MLLGIDVGGTFTDAVLVQDGTIIAQAKSPTTYEDLLQGILNSLDQVIARADCQAIERVALSTTIVTNALIQGKTDRVGLLAMSGPGLDITGLIPTEPQFLSGYIDHRGRAVARPRPEEVAEACHRLHDCRVFAVTGKFAVRNPRHEQLVAEWVQEHTTAEHVTVASAVSGSLNFVRRTNSAYYNAAVYQQFSEFAAAIERALASRKLTAPVYVLKADGGTMPLAAIKKVPVETLFTGPAASVLGIMAVHAFAGPAVSVDIGGTTTDIALWQHGTPLFAERGAWVNGYPTAVRSFRLHSVGIGGDSYVQREKDGIKVGPLRRGPAMAAGGEWPALSDAMIVAGCASFGDAAKAEEAMRQLALAGESPQQTAQQVLQAASTTVCQAIAAMVAQREAEPVYRVADIIRGETFTARKIIGVGGAAAGLVPFIARELNIPYEVPAMATVANALGAAVARPTLEVTVRADTAQGEYTVAELGVQQKLPGRRTTLAEVQDLARQALSERASQAGIAVQEVETVYEEQFNMVRGFSTVGKSLACQLQIKPGVLMKINGREGQV